MTTDEQKKFIEKMYVDIFKNTNVDNISLYFSKDYAQETNYDKLNHKEFVDHVSTLKQMDQKTEICVKVLMSEPGQVLVRSIVRKAEQIDGGPPLSLLMSYWIINNEDLISSCKEVELASA